MEKYNQRKMSGTAKQIQFATDLLDKMDVEFAACKKVAPENFHPVFDQIMEILSNSYAGDVIELLESNNETGQKYYKRFASYIMVDACPAAMEIKRNVYKK